MGLENSGDVERVISRELHLRLVHKGRNIKKGGNKKLEVRLYFTGKDVNCATRDTGYSRHVLKEHRRLSLTSG